VTIPGLLLVGVFAAGQSGGQAPTGCLPSGLGTAAMQLCLGEEAAKRGEASPKESAERTRHLEAAADHYRRASDVGTADVQLQALTALAQILDAPHLNDAARRETVLRELIAFVPTDPRFAFDLAALQESQGFIDLAEDTLLTARQQHPADVETFRKLAQFFARRATALHASAREPTPVDTPNPGEPDDNGIYRVGAELPPPSRAGIARYPEDATAAGIQGAVQAEIVIDHEGAVTDARIVNSIPLLDEAALKAVREWRYEPTIVNGRPVPVRMVVTVNFTLSQ